MRRPAPCFGLTSSACVSCAGGHLWGWRLARLAPLRSDGRDLPANGAAEPGVACLHPPPTRLHACLHCSGPQCSTSRGRHPLDDRVITRPRVLLLSRWGRYMSEAVGLVASPRLVHTASLWPATMSLRGRHSETARTAQLRLRYLLCTALRSASGRRLWASQLESRAAFWCARNVSWTGLAYQAGVGGLLSSAVVGHILVRATLVQLRCSPGASASPRGDGR